MLKRPATVSSRVQHMRTAQLQAKKADLQGDVVARTQAADNWYFWATPHDIDRAPKYLTWTGRK